jgi:hypothetical protein
MIRYPNIIGNTDAQKLEQIKSYLHQLADELNYQLDNTSNLVSGYASTANSAADAAKLIKKDDPISNFNDIKALIIKSADIVDAYYEEISKKLEGQYVAESDFGTYKEETQAQLTATSDQVKVVVEKQEIIETDLAETERELRSEIKQQADSISMSVENGETTAQIILKVGDKEIPATIDMKGLVTFSNLANADDTTVINGGNITAGAIKSKDGKSVVIDLDNSVVTMTGSITSEKEADKDGNIHSANFSPYGLDAYVVENGETLASKTFVAGKGITIVEKGDEPNPLVLGASNGERYLFGLTDPKGDTYAVSKGYLGKYGYAGKAISLGYFTTEEELTTALAEIYDAMDNQETKLITYSGYPSNSDWRWFGIIDRSSANNGSFVAHSAYLGGSKIMKHKYGGTWQDCEWENPPLFDNVRYRTTERRNGKPVYRQVVVVTNNTVLSGDAVTKIPHDIPDIDVSMGVEIVVRTRNYAIPYITASESTSIDMVDDIYIHLRTTGTTSWAAGRKWYFDMKYVTK